MAVKKIEYIGRFGPSALTGEDWVAIVRSLTRRTHHDTWHQKQCFGFRILRNIAFGVNAVQKFHAEAGVIKVCSWL